MTDKFILNSKHKFNKLERDETVPEYIFRRVKEYVKAGRKNCITNAISGETHDYSDIEPISRRVASALYKRGMKKGDCVVYSSHEGANLHIFFLGVWRANGFLRSSYPEDIDETLLDRVIESQARWILCDEQFAAENLAVASRVPWPVEVLVFSNADGCISISEEMFNNDGNHLPKQEIGSEDVALILPTSGTTGSSKGAIYTHSNLLKNIIMLENIPLIDMPEKPFLLTSKTTHFTGSVLPFGFFASGRYILLMPQASKENIFRAVSEYKVRGIFGFPKFLLCLANHDEARDYNLSSLKYFSTGGQSVEPSFVSAIKSLPDFKSFIVIYGMTEVGLITFYADVTAKDCNLNELPRSSSGKLVAGNSLMVRDIETGKILGCRGKGELYIKSPFTCSGYLSRPKENAETFQKGWIRTGDVGYYDERGFIFLVDRAKNIFKYYNNHISPTELENVILGHPNVAETCVIGVPDPDGGDSIPRAFVVLKSPLKKNVSPSTISENIKDFVNSQVASYKHLRGGLHIVTHMPVGKTGKITRKLLAEIPIPIPHVEI